MSWGSARALSTGSRGLGLERLGELLPQKTLEVAPTVLLPSCSHLPPCLSPQLPVSGELSLGQWFPEKRGFVLIPLPSLVPRLEEAVSA